MFESKAKLGHILAFGRPFPTSMTGSLTTRPSRKSYAHYRQLGHLLSLQEANH